MQRVQADILYKKGSFILLLLANITSLHQKAKADGQIVCAFVPHSFSSSQKQIFRRMGSNIYSSASEGVNKMTTEKAVCSSFPRSARAHAEKCNIRRKQHDFSEVTENRKATVLKFHTR